MSLSHERRNRRKPIRFTADFFDTLEERRLLSGNAPTTVTDIAHTGVNTQLSVIAPGVLANDSDAESDPLTATLVDNAAHGSLTLNPDGSFTYDPDLGFNGTDSFTYVANDGTSDSSVTAVTITVNTAPTAVDDAGTTGEDSPLSVDAANGVLSNDTDVDAGALLTATLVTPAAHGQVVLNPNGSYVYTPDANYNGADSFTYRASDGIEDGNVATVNLTVTAANDAPVANGDTHRTPVGGPLIVSAGNGVLSNDTDAENDALTAAVVTDASHGTLNLNPDGSFTYTPDAGYNGVDTFTYTASDGTATSGPATVTITVNSTPVAVNDNAGTTNEDTPLTLPAPGLLLNDTDADAGTTLVPAVATQPAHGTVAINADGSFTYTPDANYNGPDSFTYTISDGVETSAPATVTITVAPVNDEPVAADDAATTAEDTPLTVNAPGVLANDTDAEGDALAAALVTLPAHGGLTLNADGSFTYTPDLNYNGADSFTYKVNDGTADSNTATVNITVTAVNDVAVATDDSYSTTEDGPLTVPAAGVLTNDADADGDTLAAVLVSGPSHGTLNLNADGSFTYTPELNFNGSDSFTYKANDGTADSNVATVNIVVTAVNDAPIATDDNYSTAVDAPLTVPVAGVLANDTDVENGPLTAVLVTQAAHGGVVLNPDGSFTYTPNQGYNGPDTFTYQASDGTLNSNTATVTITVNSAPVATDDTFTTAEDTPLTVPAAGVLTNDTDADAGAALTATVVDLPLHGSLTLNADGSFTYTPNADYNGADSFTYKASDGFSQSNLATVNITVTAVNDAPVAADDHYNTPTGAGLTIAAPGVLGNDADIDGDALTAIVVTQPSNGMLTLNADGSFTYTPNGGFNGTDSFTYQASDGTLTSNTATVTITVNNVPVAVDDAVATDEDTPLTIAAPGVLGNDTDADAGATLVPTVATQPANGTVTLNADGSFTYTPNANFNGSDTFTYTVSDGIDTSAPATVTITINAVEDAPVAVSDSYATQQGTSLNIPAPGVLGNDTDADNDTLTAVVVNGPTHGTLTLNPDGSFTYTPNDGFSGPDTFTYKANDGTADSNVTTVTINVNTAPVAASDAYTTTAGAPLTIAAPGVLANDTDAEGNALTATVVSQPTNGTLTLNADGSFTYTPNPDFAGTDSFTYKANDGVADSDAATVTITVNPQVAPAPTASDISVTRIPGASIRISLAGKVTNATGVAVSQEPQFGQVLIDTNGTPDDATDDFLVYIPENGSIRPDSFSYIVSNGQGDVAAGNVSVDIAGVGLAPNPDNARKKDLYIVGTDGNDKIKLVQIKKGVKVVINGHNKGSFVPTGRIVVQGGDGNDRIDATGVKRNVVFYGGNGNDTLIGGLGADGLYAGNGNDTIVADRSGRDDVLGGSGKDVIQKS